MNQRPINSTGLIWTQVLENSSLSGNTDQSVAIGLSRRRERIEVLGDQGHKKGHKEKPLFVPIVSLQFKL